MNIGEIIVGIIVLIIILGMVGGLIFFVLIGYQNPEIEIVRIEDKYVKAGDKSSTYLVSTDKEVYKISDLFFIGKFNSSDIYASLKIGEQYKIYTTGYRMPFWSEYKNINKVEEIK